MATVLPHGRGHKAPDRVQIIKDAQAGIDVPKRHKPGRHSALGEFYKMDELDIELLIKMVDAHCSKKEICNMLGYSNTTLDKKLKSHGVTFSELVDNRRGHIAMKLRKIMLELAMDGDSKMIVWASKNYLGMSDRQEIKQKIELDIPIKTYELPDNGRG